MLRIRNGQLLSEAQLIQKTSYEVKNHRSDAVRAYVRSLKTPGWTLKQRPAGSVETPDALILALDVPAGKSATLEVEWQQPVQRAVAIDSSNAAELLRVYLGGGQAAPAVARVLQQALELQSNLVDQRKEEARLRTQHAAWTADSARVRENLNVLRRTKGNAALEQELARKIATLERDLGLLSGRLVQLSETIADLEAKLKQLLADVSLQP